MNKHLTTTALCITSLILLLTSGVLTAQTITLTAIDDFPSIEEGEVPYEVNTESETLGIDTTIVEFRDGFARATTSFTGAGDIYDLTLNTVAEVAGESRYRVVVNGVVVGVINNDPITVDTAEQEHTLEDVFIPVDATLSIESNAATNGLLPEDEGLAYASGQWRSLTLQNDNPTQTVDLFLNARVVESDLRAGDNFTLAIDITNNSQSDTATQPLLFVQVPPTIDFTPPAECTVRTASTTLTCELAELEPQQTRTVNLPGRVNVTGEITIELSVFVDQNDSDQSNNQALAMVDTRDPNVPSRVDLVVSASASTDTPEIGSSLSYTINTTNAHATTVATSPVVGVVLPDNLQFQSSSDCTANEQMLLCNLSELIPAMTATVEFSATVLDEGNTNVLISVSAAEIEEEISDNELTLPVTVLSIASALEQPGTSAPDTETQSGNGGGGSFSLLLLPFFVRRFRDLLQNQKSSEMPSIS